MKMHALGPHGDQQWEGYGSSDTLNVFYLVAPALNHNLSSTLGSHAPGKSGKLHSTRKVW